LSYADFSDNLPDFSQLKVGDEIKDKAGNEYIVTEISIDSNKLSLKRTSDALTFEIIRPILESN